MNNPTHHKKEKKKIQFTEDVSLKPHGVECVFKSLDVCEIDLGLLSSLHTYEVNFDMIHALGKEVDIPPLQSLVVEIISLENIESGGHHVTLHVKCMEGIDLNENVLFENSNNETVTLKIVSRIMGHHLGTPSLKSGVKLLHSSSDAMSDATDWQGFD